MKLLGTITGEGFTCSIDELDDGSVTFLADADIDADGAPHAYHAINSLGLDDLRNARDNEGNFCGILTDRYGHPLIQGPDDPAPGWYISTTTYELKDQPANTQRRFVNAETVPFIVIPPLIIQRTRGIVMGCKALVTDTRTGRQVVCMVADQGPRTRVGEISIAAAKALAIPFSPRTGGIDKPVFRYQLWPGIPAEVNGVNYQLQAA